MLVTPRMRFVFLAHSVISDWNNGNAHFLRGLMRALAANGHEAVCLEQEDNWSLRNLRTEQEDAVARFRIRFPDLHVERYPAGGAAHAVGAALEAAAVLVVHEWNEPEVVALAGRLAGERRVRAFFHDTHHRVVLDAGYRARLGLKAFDGILAYSPSLADRHRALGGPPAHVLHEAADTTVFGPRDVPPRDDVVFIGNYGEGDRDAEIEEFVFGPRRDLPHLRYAVYGVRYPKPVLERMRDGLAIDYRGWLANAEVADAYSAASVALHIPRRQYVRLLPGTPTIRVFEALASGACLVSLPWPDTDGLFSAGLDYAVARTPAEMRDLLAWLCADSSARERFRRHGRATILARHTCAHRAEQLAEIAAS